MSKDMTNWARTWFIFLLDHFVRGHFCLRKNVVLLLELWRKHLVFSINLLKSSSSSRKEQELKK